MSENKEQYTSVGEYMSPLKSLMSSQMNTLKKRNWVAMVADNKLKKSYYKTEHKIIENVLLHAKSITNIAIEGHSTDTIIFQKWIKELLSFYKLHEKRVKTYMKINPLEELSNEDVFDEELIFQQDITGNMSGFKVMYDKMKVNLEDVKKGEINLRWRLNEQIPLTMESIIGNRHKEVADYMYIKVSNKKKTEKWRYQVKVK